MPLAGGIAPERKIPISLPFTRNSIFKYESVLVLGRTRGDNIAEREEERRKSIDYPADKKFVICRSARTARVARSRAARREN